MQKSEALRVAVTGAAGFIGSHLLLELGDRGHEVSWAVDSFSPAYGGDWCKLRSSSLNPDMGIELMDLAQVDPELIAERIHGSDVVIHLAAFPGVRQGESLPHRYVQNNILSTSAVLTACEKAKPRAVLVASSSSIYGDRGAAGACIESSADGTGLKSHYAMTKWMNEIQAQGFVRRSAIPTLALRFFTVYGEWGRPDMAYSSFAKALTAAAPIRIYGRDGGTRNMTYVRDATEIVLRLAELAASDQHSDEGFNAYNVASGTPTSALTMLDVLAEAMGKEPHVEHVDRPAVDALATHADLDKVTRALGVLPSSNLKQRLTEFAHWFMDHRKLFGS